MSCFMHCLLFLHVLVEYFVLTLVASMFLGTCEDDMHGIGSSTSTRFNTLQSHITTILTSLSLTWLRLKVALDIMSRDVWIILVASHFVVKRRLEF